MERSAGFSPEALKAPFMLRLAALCIDYMLILAVPIIWLLSSRLFGDGAGGSIPPIVWIIAVLVWVIDFLLVPLFRGQTVGKMLSGITIVKMDGTPVRLGGLVLRNIIGYFLTLITLGLGFLVSAVNSTGRSLHDYVGGTIVVSGRKR